MNLYILYLPFIYTIEKKFILKEAAKKLLAAQQANSCNNFLKALSTQENSSTEKQHSEVFLQILFENIF